MTNPEQSSQEVAPAGFGLLVSSGYGWFFLGVGIYLPFFPVWLESKGLVGQEIGIILAIPIFIRVLTSGLISSYADRKPDRAVVITWLYWLSFAAGLLYLFANGFWELAIVTLIISNFSNPILPLLDALALSGVRRFGSDYGRIRVLGSVTFIFANLGGGLALGLISPEFIIWLIVAINAFGAVYSHCLPRIGRAKNRAALKDPNFTFKVAMKRPGFIAILLAAGLIQASHSLIYGFGSIHWQSLGYSGSLIGALWAIGVFAEVVLFQVATKVLKFVSPVGLMAIAAVGGTVRWTMMTFEPDLYSTFLLQVLHGLSFGAAHIATMYFIMQSVSESKIGSAQGIGFVLSGVTTGVSILTSGFIYTSFGATGFWFSTAMALAALVLVLFNWKHQPTDQPQSLGDGGDTVLEK